MDQTRVKKKSNKENLISLKYKNLRPSNNLNKTNNRIMMMRKRSNSNRVIIKRGSLEIGGVELKRKSSKMGIRRVKQLKMKQKEMIELETS